ncbi:MAG: LytTR family DNA-binding domain-containing protein [Bacteroidales bacterium]|nr:LytTR family DNA-binding domain-containing protein [Bacteroidales bacterium]
MRTLIIEDEIPAQIQLERLINTLFPEFEVIAKIESVRGAVEWLQSNQPDIIFMDVELSDGQCFEIFKQVKIESPVIITTAYNDYAIKAFKVNSIDYLLKPIDRKEFVDAVEKSKKIAQHLLPDYKQIEELLSKTQPKEYKKRFTVKIGDRILILSTSDIAYFYSEEKATFIATNEGKRYITDLTLDALEEQLNPKDYFRLSRGCITHIHSIKSVSRYFNSRLKVILNPAMQEDVLVSRIRIPQFLKWLEGE